VKRLRESLAIYLGVLLFVIVCLCWSLISLPAYYVLPRRIGAAFGRRGIMSGYRVFLWGIQALGVYRVDLRAISALRNEPALILAPNHPQIIDAILILSQHPNVICVMKAQLMGNILFGPGSRLARFISNDAPRRIILQAVESLREGGMLLLFPEGTRTVQNPVNPFQHTVGAVSKHAQVPVQTLLIETDSPYMSKGWSPLRWAPLPVTYRVRLGRRFEPPANVRVFTEELEQYFRTELQHSLQSGWLARRAAGVSELRADT
jgi:1-acyl-sn-glycerol-3-phosphate acyltransferase